MGINLLTIIGLFGLLLAGCVSQEDLDQQFRQRRQKSYQALTRQAAAAGDSQIETAQGPLSLDAALDLALQYNKDVQQARAELLRAEGQMTEAIANALPTAGLAADAFVNDTNVIGQAKDTYSVGLQVRQPLYLGGLTKAAIDAASVFTYATNQRLRQSVQQVQLSVSRFYLDAMLAEELQTVAAKALDDANKNLQDVRKRHNAGVATRFDVLRAEVRVTAAEAELIAQQNQTQVAQAALLNEIGVSQLSEITLTDRLAFATANPNADRCLQEAMRQRPELLVGEANIRLAIDQIAAEQSSNRPKLYAQGDYQRNNPGFSSLEGGREWDRTMRAGLVLEWAFFDGFRTDGRVAQAKAQLRQQEIQLRQLEQRTQLEVTQAILSLENSRRFVQSQSGNVENAEEALRLSRVNFNEGTGTSLDIITAELSLSQARSDYITSVHAHEVALLELEAAVGVIGEMPLPGLEDQSLDTSVETVSHITTAEPAADTLTEKE